jgi:serine phosphatase RsbU (regulator of sigma subunit)
MSRRWIVPAIAAAVGFSVLVVAVNRAKPVPSAGFRMDRDAAVRLAREITREFGLDTQLWHSGTVSLQDRRLQFWINSRSSGPMDRLVTPLTTKVGLAALSGGEEVTVILNADGGFIAFHRTGAKPGMTPPADPKAIAIRAFTALARSYAGSFHLVTDGAPAPGETQYVWEAESTHPDELTWAVRVSVAAEGLRAAELVPNLSRRASERYVREKSLADAIAGVAVACAFGLILAAGGIFLYGWFRGTVERGATVTAGLVFFLSALLSNLVGAGSQRYLVSEEAEKLSALGTVLDIVVLTLGGMVLIGAGEALWRKGARDRWNSLLLLLRGAISARRVGEAIFFGLLFSVPLAAAQYVAALLPGVGFEWEQPDLPALASPTPWLEPLIPPVALRWLIVFGVVVPLLERLPVSFARRVLIILVVMASILTFSPFSPGLPTAAAAGVLMGSLCLFILARYDILTLFAALCGYSILRQSAVLLVTNSDALRSSANFDLLLVAAGCAIAGVIAWRGRDVALEEMAPAVEPVSQREKLKSEFSTARDAQMRMLPNCPPEIPGFEVSGMCHPAREVGGDLYDYPRLADGRHVICVADVSGKGMSAALYMTLTKGVLTAAAEDSDDVAEIASQLNTHIYSAGRRKIFVTAALAALDPNNRVLEYARAGHNPIVWRSRSGGFTKLLQPRGLGLGVGPVHIFDRTLEVQRLEIEPGDTLVFYSDGVTEAMNEEMEQFGEERLMASVNLAGDVSAEAVREVILSDLSEFLNGNSPQDDATIVVLRAVDSSKDSAGTGTLIENSPQPGAGTLG